MDRINCMVAERKYFTFFPPDHQHGEGLRPRSGRLSALRRGAGRRGMLGTMSPELQTHVRTQLIRSLAKPMPAQLREQILRLLLPMR
jgi:hypothetical protein